MTRRAMAAPLSRPSPLALVGVVALHATLLAGPASAALRYVAPSGSDAGACGAAATPCRTLQYAVDHAAAGDEVRIAAGQYAGVLDHAAPFGYAPATVRQVVYVDRTLLLRGGFTTANWTTPNPAVNVTTIDAQGAGRCVFLAGTLDPAQTNPSPVLEGLRLTGGSASGLKGYQTYDAGGAVYVWLAQATVRACAFKGNTASATTRGAGGGLAAYYAPLTLADCTFEGNTASTADRGLGGGAFVYPTEAGATLSGNTLRTNTGGSAAAGGSGGGVYLTQNAATLSGNTVERNAAASGVNGVGWGGGVYAGACALTSRSNSIRDNRASADAASGSGGGVYLVDGSLDSTGDQVTGNTADARTGGGSGRGGGLAAATQSAGSAVRVTMRNAAISSNRACLAAASNDGSQGGGVHLSGADATFSSCTVEGNATSAGGPASGGGIYAYDSAVRFVGGVIRGNTAGATAGGGGGIYVAAPGQRASVGLSLVDTLVEGNAAGAPSVGAGGGVMVERYSPTQLLGNRVVGNTAAFTGAGIALGSPVVDVNAVPTVTVPAVVAGNQFSGNGPGGASLYAAWGSAGWGGLVVALNRIEGTAGGATGAVRLEASPYTRLDSNWIAGNGGFGGVLASYTDHAVLEANTVSGNRGSVWVSGNWVELRRNLVVGNGSAGPADPSDGEVQVNRTGHDLTIANNVIAGNAGGGLFLFGNVVPFPFDWDRATSGLVAHNTIVTAGAPYAIDVMETRGPAASLASAAAQGSTLLAVPADPGWKVGDTVSVASWSGDLTSAGWEAHRIASIQGGGLVVDAPLLHPYAKDSGVFGTRLAFVNNVVTGSACGIVARESDVLVDGVNWFGNTKDVCNSQVVENVGTLYYLVGVTRPTAGDPRFVAPASGDYHLGAGSAAIDKGVAGAATVDFDNQPRPAGSAPDLGADEVAGACTAVQAVAIGGPASATAGVPVTLTATAAPANSSAVVDLRWMPEPTSGQGTASATYTFAAAGSPVVTAMARNCGGAVSSSRSIGVSGCGLTCAATAPAAAQVGVGAPFTGSATAAGCTDPVTYRWGFGDGSEPVAGTSASHAYAAAGRYRWTLTATSGAAVCESTGEVAAAAKTGHLRRVLAPAR